MDLYRCANHDKILTEKALSEGVCAGCHISKWNGEEKVLKVAVAIPTEGNTKAEAYDNHLVNCFRLGGLQERWRYERRNPRYEFSWFTAGRMLTQMAREKLVEVSVQANMDYIVMYDDDMVLPPDMICRFLEDMELHPEIDILAGLAFMRSAPHYAVIYTVKEGYDQVRNQSYYTNQWVKNYPKDKLVECDAVGFGAVIIKMSMVKKMKPPYFMSTTNTGEDIFFCVNAKNQAGARVFVDTRIKLGHLGDPICIDENYWEQYKHVHKVPVEQSKYKYAIDETDVRNDYVSLER